MSGKPVPDSFGVARSVAPAVAVGIVLALAGFIVARILGTGGLPLLALIGWSGACGLAMLAIGSVLALVRRPSRFFVARTRAIGS